MEYDYVVANEPVRFITHVSDLVTLEPRRDGPAHFTFTHSSGEILAHTDPAVARAGIYIPELSFVKTGEWRMLLEIPLEGQTYSTEITHMDPSATGANEIEAV